MASYHCYKCEKPTVITKDSFVPKCSRCGSDFVEEVAETHVRGTPVRNEPAPQGRVPQYITSFPPDVQNSGYPGTFPNNLPKYPNMPPPHLQPNPQGIPYHGTSPPQVTFHPGSRTPPTYQPPLYVSPLYPSLNPSQNYSTPLPYYPPMPQLRGNTLYPSNLHPGSHSPPGPVPTHPLPNPTHQPPQPHLIPQNLPPSHPSIFPAAPTHSPQPTHFIPPINPMQAPQQQTPPQQTPQQQTPQPTPQVNNQNITKPIPNISSTQQSLYPVVVPVRNTDGDDLYAEDSLPDVSRLDFSKTRFKADRDDPMTTSLYLSLQNAPITLAPNPQPNASAMQVETEQTSEQPIPTPVNPVPPPANALTGLFTGFVDVLRDGFDKLDELSYQIAPNVRRFRGGAPPAAEKERQKLQTIQITGEEMVNQKDCPICFCDWDLGESAKLMPCGHCFHEPCLMPWLVQRNSCPICRFELTTEDRRYERYREHREAHNL